MSSEKPLGKYESLVIAYLTGNAEEREVAELEAWVRRDAANEAYFREAKRAWILGSFHEDVGQIDVEQAWEDVLEKTDRKAKTVSLSPTRRKWRQKIWAVAASLALLMAAGWWALGGRSDQTRQLIAEAEVLEARLPDGSMVTLNQGSELDYMFDKSRGIRQVSMQGEVFFEVKRDEKYPFVIESNDMMVEVLGTSFYVEALLDLDTARVIVQSGRVSVALEDQEVTLEAGETSLVDRKAKVVSKTQNKDVNYLSWQTNILHFEDASLKEIVRVLNRHFESQIDIANETIAQCRMTATFSEKPLPTIISIIEKTLGITSESSNGRSTFVGSSCK